MAIFFNCLSLPEKYPTDLPSGEKNGCDVVPSVPAMSLAVNSSTEHVEPADCAVNELPSGETRAGRPERSVLTSGT
jgi:hypothetical protein